MVAADDPRMGQNVLAALGMTLIALVELRLRVHGAGRGIRIALSVVMLLLYASALF
jgi:hypothetical protein